MTQPRFLVIAGMILAAALSRIVPHPYNITPITAIALFGGAYLTDKRLALAIPLLAMLASDMVLGFHSTLPFVYLCFAGTVLIGMALRHRKQALPIVGATLTGSVLFFIVTNFGVWTRLYAHNLALRNALWRPFHCSLLATWVYRPLVWLFSIFEKGVQAQEDALRYNKLN